MTYIFLILGTWAIFLQFPAIAQPHQNQGRWLNSETLEKGTVTCTCSENYQSYWCKIISNNTVIDKPMKCYETFNKLKEQKSVCVYPQNKNSGDKKSIQSFNFIQCPTPKVSFKEIMSYLGISKTDALKIKLTNSNISFFNKNLWSNLEDVTTLDVSANRLSFIIEELQRKMPNLINLNVVRNNVKLYKGIFKSATKLNALDLGNNDLKILQPGVFQNLVNLSHLNIWGNKLTDLKREVLSDTPNLISLDISSNEITKLRQDVLIDLKKLSAINLYSNRIEIISEGLFANNKELSIVWIYGMKTLRSIPSKLVANLTKLDEVNLSKCNIEHVPEDLFWGSFNITIIILDENSIFILPENIFRDGYKLIEINLGRNNIMELPNNIFSNQVNLQSLTLANNQLTHIKKELFQSLYSLKELDLSSNKIKTVNSDAFERTTKITHLSLSKNLLFKLDNETNPSTLSVLKRLKTLDLSYNFLSTIPNDWRHFGSIEKLNLTNNKFSSLQIRRLFSLSFSEEKLTIDLAYNNISTVDFGDVELFSSSLQRESLPVEIQLEGNPLNCDCNTYDLLQYYIGEKFADVKKKLILSKLLCATPTRLKNKPIIKELSHELKCEVKDCYEDTFYENKCKCFNLPQEQTLEIYCKNRQLSTIPDVSQKINLKKLTNYTIELNLTGNFITEISPESYRALKNITKLDLSFNNISEINISNLSTRLKVLKLHNNNISYLGPESIEFMSQCNLLKEVTLHNNLWRCDCSTVNLLHFIQTNIMKVDETINKITCPGGKLLNKLTVYDICPQRYYIFIGYFVGIPVFLVTVAIFILFYRYEENIKVWCFANGILLSLVTQDDLDSDKEYDAYVICAEVDKEFVLEELRPGLEENNERKFKLCLEYRDWLAGDFKPECITKSILNSRRTIVVVSNNYKDNSWVKMGFMTAHTQAMQQGRARVIIILYGDMETTEDLDSDLKVYISMNTHIKWGDRRFWKKLQYYLTHVNAQKNLSFKEFFKIHSFNKLKTSTV